MHVRDSGSLPVTSLGLMYAAAVGPRLWAGCAWGRDGHRLEPQDIWDGVTTARATLVVPEAANPLVTPFPPVIGKESFAYPVSSQHHQCPLGDRHGDGTSWISQRITALRVS